MFAIFHYANGGWNKVHVITKPSYEAAVAHVVDLFGEISYIEEDADNPGFHDLITKNGDICTIEPAKA
jgi:hypothetical protein